MPANESLYKEMSVPFASREEANAALEAFFDGVAELRKKHKMQDIYVIHSNDVMDESGESCTYFGRFSFGNSVLHESLTAWAFGQEQAERQEKIAKLIAEGKSIARGRKAS